MKAQELFTLRHKNIYAVPILHYTMEMAALVKMAFQKLQPDCVAVELAETMQLQLLHAASRLPDISIVVTENSHSEPHYYLCEPCEPCFEGLRSALENNVAAFCIDLDVDDYPLYQDFLPDPYSLHSIGLKRYYQAYLESTKGHPQDPLDHKRELYMAKRLKELSLQYDTVLFIGGFSHVNRILQLVDQNVFPELIPAHRNSIELCTLTEESCREVLAEYGWMTLAYEHARAKFEKEDFLKIHFEDFPPDRLHIILQLYKKSGEAYEEKLGHSFAGYHFRNLMKFGRNYAFVKGKLVPNLFQLLNSAKSCVDHNYAYETWLLATSYHLRKNIDNLPELNLSVEQVWGHSKLLKFHLKQKSRKSSFMQMRKKDSSKMRFKPPSPFSICSYPKEDVVVERFGDFLKKKGTLILSEEGAKTIPFSTGIEDGIDTRETIRHFFEHKLYVKVFGKPPGAASSIVVIFDEDESNENYSHKERYPWKVTWMGEHNQESDMAFYATDMLQNIVGPGISRCEYGGFMMSSPPRRLFDVWSDPDYVHCHSKAEVLLMAAIEYAVKPIVVYVAKKPPRSKIKSFASRFGKKVVYIPIGQLSPVTLNKIRVFHVLDGYDKREIAGDYIF